MEAFEEVGTVFNYYYVGNRCLSYYRISKESKYLPFADIAFEKAFELSKSYEGGPDHRIHRIPELQEETRELILKCKE